MRLPRTGWILALFLAASLVAANYAAAASWDQGDVFVGVSNGTYYVYDNSGVYKESISDGLGGFTTGCAFNPDETKLYATHFSNNNINVYDNAHPHSILQTIDTSGASSYGNNESVVFAANGDFYVGNPGGNKDVLKYNSAGVLQQTYDVATDYIGSDWIDLAADQCTLYYTSEGFSIQRYDVCNDVQLSNFATGIGLKLFALRLLPPGDGTAGLIVADYSNVKRLDGSGAVVQTYDVSGEDTWFSMNLDPNGTSFWAGNFGTANFYRFNIATGAVEVGPINTGTGGSTLYGICLKGEPTAAVTKDISLEPATDTNCTGDSHTVTATIIDDNGNPVPNETVSFSIISGPNTGALTSAVTDVNGQASAAYTSSDEGTDVIKACFAPSAADPEECATAQKTWNVCNLPPDTSNAAPTLSCLWPPNHQFVDVGIVGVTDPDSDPVTITITGVTSDEPTATIVGAGGVKHVPDAIVGTSTAKLRAERSGTKDGRVYQISFLADDGISDAASGSVKVRVPHDVRKNTCNAVDSGQLYNATQ